MNIYSYAKLTFDILFASWGMLTFEFSLEPFKYIPYEQTIQWTRPAGDGTFYGYIIGTHELILFNFETHVTENWATFTTSIYDALFAGGSFIP